MINNYQYFLTLAETNSIASAAKSLFISHQALSRYLSNLENQYGVSLFLRKPVLQITPEGKVLLDHFRQIKAIEKNIENELSLYSESTNGIIQLGTTEGRYELLASRIIPQFNKLYPYVKVSIEGNNSLVLQNKIINSQLDMFLGGIYNINNENLAFEEIAQETMYLVISDSIIRQYFPDEYPKCIERFQKGVDLTQFQQVPFVLNKKNFNSRIVIDRHLIKIGAKLNCVNEMTSPSVHHRLTAQGFAASFCLTMYLADINYINKLADPNSKIQIFPIKDLNEKFPYGIIYLRGRVFPKYTSDFIKFLKTTCFSKEDLLFGCSADVD